MLSTLVLQLDLTEVEQRRILVIARRYGFTSCDAYLRAVLTYTTLAYVRSVDVLSTFDEWILTYTEA